MEKDLFTVKFDTNPSPWFNTYVEIAFSKKKLQPVVDELVKECSNKDFQSSHSYNSIVDRVIKKSWNEDCGSMRPYLKAIHSLCTSQCPEGADWHNGYVAAARSLSNKMAWMTPGFVEAKRYNDIYGG
tara:strand:+ start:614 stop:997 length:384 start_codon:yes stop_codon:yes gene_type:complete